MFESVKGVIRSYKSETTYHKMGLENNNGKKSLQLKTNLTKIQVLRKGRQNPLHMGFPHYYHITPPLRGNPSKRVDCWVIIIFVKNATIFTCKIPLGRFQKLVGAFQRIICIILTQSDIHSRRNQKWLSDFAVCSLFLVLHKLLNLLASSLCITNLSLGDTQPIINQSQYNGILIIFYF